MISVVSIYNVYFLVLKKIYPCTYAEYVYKYSEEYEIESNWIFALIKAESNINSEVVSQSGAIGLMQLMEKTADEVAKGLNLEEIDLKNPEENIMLRYEILFKFIRLL